MKASVKKNFYIYGLSFLLPVVIILASLFILKIFPFGENSFLYWDAELQFVNYLGYFKSIFTSNNDFFYTFSRMGGSSMVDFSAFYLLSPLNFLMFLCPNEYLNIGLEFLTILKIALCGLTFSYFLNKEFKASYINIVFATTYALCAHNLMYMSNVIFIDGIILLPLVLVGINKIISNKNFNFFILTTLLSMITHAYMGYVIILFSATFFIYKILLQDNINPKELFEKIKIYIFSLLITLGLSSIIFIPVKLALVGGKYSFFNIWRNAFNINTDIISIFAKFYTNSILVNGFWKENSPYVFVGIIFFFLIILYFFNSNIKKREKIVTGCYIVFLISSFFLNILFVFWNMGVEMPNGTIFRYGFIFSFFAIYIAYKSFINISFLNKRQLLYSFLIFLVITKIILSKQFAFIYPSLVFNDCIIVSGSVILLFLALKNQNLFPKILFLILFAHCINIFSNTQYSLSSQPIMHLSQSVKPFKTNYLAVKKALDYINSIDKDFYRTEVTSYFTEVPLISPRLENIYMLHGYNAISHYSSLGKSSLVDFYQNIGFNTYKKDLIISFSEEETLFPSFFMGIKYIVSPSDNLQYPFEKIYEIPNCIHHSELSLFYNELSKYKNLYIYKNKLALPIAFGINNNIDLNKSINENNFQNELIKLLAHNDYGDIYKKITFPLAEKTDVKIQSNDIVYLFAKSEYNVNDLFSIYNQSNMHYKKSNIDKKIEFCDLNNQTFYIGNNLKEEVINFDFDVLSEYSKYFSTVQMAYIYENVENLKKYYDRLSNSPCSLNKITSSHLNGKCNITQNNQLVFLTIPYDENWNITIDGQKVQTKKAFNSMMTFPIKKGIHNIEMQFRPKGILCGVICSVLSLIMLIIWNIKEKYKK